MTDPADTALSLPARTTTRVLHVIAPAAFGGLEQVVLQLAAGRAARGLPTHALALTGLGADAPPLVPLLERAGVHTTIFRSAPRAYRAQRDAIRSAARECGADVVHTHGYLPDVLASAPVRKAGIALVSTAHGFTGGGLRKRLYEWLQRRAWKRFDLVVAVSQPLRERLVHSGVPESTLVLCPNAWGGSPQLSRAAARARLGLPAQERLIGWIGRLSREKGADVMIRALAELPDSLVVVMIGDGPERAALTHLASQLGVAGRVRWTGTVPDAGACMAAFDAFALSSRTEGTPMVLFEAMAALVPIVSTTVGGVPDVLSPAEAILVPADNPHQLAAALGRLFADGNAAAARAAAAARLLELRYDLARWLDRYEEFYAKATARRAS